MDNINMIQFILSIFSGIVLLHISIYIVMKLLLLIQIHYDERHNTTKNNKEGKFNKSLGVRELN